MLIDNLSRNILKLLQDGLEPVDLAEKLTVGRIVQADIIEILPGGKARIQLQGQTLLARLSQNAVPGQTLTARVEQPFPNPVLKILDLSDPPETSSAVKQGTPAETLTKSDRATISSVQRASAGMRFLTDSDLGEMTLVPGQELRGIVSKVVDGETLSVKLDGKEAAVRVLGPNAFSPGDEILVTVESLAEGYVLTAKSRENVPRTISSAEIKPYLAARQDFGEMAGQLEKAVSDPVLMKDLKIDPSVLEKLRETLRVLLAKETAVPDGGTSIRNKIDRSGINYEAKVKRLLTETPSAENKALLTRDLKGQLLKLGQNVERVLSEEPPSLSGPQTRKAAEFLGQIKQATANIELQQLSNVYAKQENQALQAQIPFALASGGETVKLFVNSRSGKDPEKQGQKKSFTMVFLLDLTALGNVRVDTQADSGRLSVKIGAEKQEVAEFIQTKAPELKSRLREIGFDSELTCCVQKKEAMKVEDGLTRLLVSDASRLVDIKT
ncbi:MAG: flagellar hook-length control protein FliK [Nitrospinae bacterium]|nr:flagellar hook-length control protein FliK [Nitrospinota bacterium]